MFFSLMEVSHNPVFLAYVVSEIPVSLIVFRAYTYIFYFLQIGNYESRTSILEIFNFLFTNRGLF